MPDLTPRQIAILRILADADGPQAASYVAARYMEEHPEERYGRHLAGWDLAEMEAAPAGLETLGEPRPAYVTRIGAGPNAAATWEITPAGRRALKKIERAKT
jgi:hypothetical protein